MSIEIEGIEAIGKANQSTMETMEKLSEIAFSKSDSTNKMQVLQQMHQMQSLQKTEQSGFVDWLGEHLLETNQSIQKAERAARDLAVGKADNLHQVMIALESAKTSFELTVEIRNRLLEGYQELARMSI